MIHSLLLAIVIISLFTCDEINKEREVREVYEKENKTMIRYGEPNQYDEAPYGTELLVSKGNNTYELYHQMSKDPEHPRWEKMGKLMCQQ